MFAASVAAAAHESWGAATDAADARLDTLWASAARLGGFELGPADELAAALAAQRELGRLAAPLPLLDGFVAARLLAGDRDLVSRIADGSLRIVVADNDQPLVDDGGAATHVLVLSVTGGELRLRPITERRTLTGLAIPVWSEVILGDAEHNTGVSADTADEVITLLRLGLAVRAHSAAARTHELAIEHARSRQQFGKPIGSFGAVQQRAAACHIDVRGAELMIAAAIEAYESDADDWRLTSELASEFVARTAAQVQLAAHHTLAAIGYFEEHPGPWLFRRVHADVVRLRALRRDAGDVDDVLLETDASLPRLHDDPVGETFLAQFREFLDAHYVPGRGPNAPETKALAEAMGERGWWGMGWPVSAGGRDASLAEQVAFAEELCYRRVPLTWQLAAVNLEGASILRHGTPEQRAYFLPRIRSAQLKF